MITRRGLFGALLGGGVGMALPQPEPLKASIVANVTVQAIDGDEVRSFVQSEEFMRAFTDAIKTNRHGFLTDLQTEFPQ
jgi:hypothetical protein